MRQRFEGQIAGAGSTSGTRLVLGLWSVTPYGVFADAMVESPDGHRVLVAPTQQVADFIAATYTFDEVRLETVVHEVTPTQIRFASASLEVTLAVGGRTPLGRLIRSVPRRIGTAPAWCALTDPIARVVLNGVRTRGTAGNGRREWYGATDVHAVTALHGTWEGRDLGALAPVDPPCHVGFSSTPVRPSLTDVVTTVEL